MMLSGSMSMNNKQICRFGNIIILTVLLFAVVGCSSMSANNKSSGTVVSNVPVKMERPLQNFNGNTVSASKPAEDKLKEQTENKKEADKAIGKKPESATNETKVAKNGFGYRKGDIYLTKYLDVAAVNQLILVEQSETEASAGSLFLLAKNEKGEWQEQLQCKALLGKNGIDKVREGDARTPTGDFGFLMAFGAKDDPGSLVPYTKLTNTMYLCGDKEYYNQFIDVSKLDHRCGNNSEHLLSYIPQYNYALFIDYNKERIFGKGSAIFLHCFGSYPFTLGCVSVAEENMVKILRTVDANARICIYQGK